MRAPFELIADCASCRVEGAVVEVYDPDEPCCAYSVPALVRCRMCGAESRGRVHAGPGASRELAEARTGRCPLCDHAMTDVELEAHACGACGSRARLEPAAPPARMDDARSVHAALARFAREEGEGDDVAGFVAANFMGLDAAQVADRLARGERVETSFDAFFALFHRNGGGASSSSRSARIDGDRAQNDARPALVATRSPHAAHDATPAPRPSHDPRAMALAMVSVLLADGEQRETERAFLDRFLATEGFAPLGADEVRMHHPIEVSPRVPPARRRELLDLMTQLACVDGEADPSELRVVQAYARAWGVGDDELSAWVARYREQHATGAQRFFRRLRWLFAAPAPGEPGGPPLDAPTRTTSR